MQNASLPRVPPVPKAPAFCSTWPRPALFRTAISAEIDVLIVNEHEAADLAAGLGRSGDYADLAAHLAERHAISTVVTLGADGAFGWDGGVSHRAPARPVVVVDTTAAGDTFAGAFAAALEAGMTFADALSRGVVAGSLAVTRHGAQPSIPTTAEIDAASAGQHAG